MLNSIRQVYENAKTHNVYQRCLSLIFLWLSNFPAHEKFHSVTLNDPSSWLLQQHNQKSFETEQDKLKKCDLISQS